MIATARNLPPGVRYPTYVFLDAFQNFAGPDIEQALAEVRQAGLKRILSHESFSQLQRGEFDLTSMLFQASSRMVSGWQSEDADCAVETLSSNLVFGIALPRRSWHCVRPRPRFGTFVNLVSFKP